MQNPLHRFLLAPLRGALGELWTGAVCVGLFLAAIGVGSLAARSPWLGALAALALVVVVVLLVVLAGRFQGRR